MHVELFSLICNAREYLESEEKRGVDGFKHDRDKLESNLCASLYVPEVQSRAPPTCITCRVRMHHLPMRLPHRKKTVKAALHVIVV
jgi:hypothetical protein